LILNVYAYVEDGGRERIILRRVVIRQASPEVARRASGILANKDSRGCIHDV
jgi:hypothetical protein